MPIRAENLARYPANWKQISQDIRARANFRCEECNIPNHEWGFRDRDGTWNAVPRGPLIKAYGRDAKPPFHIRTHEGRDIKIIEIVLTVAHLDHVPEHVDPSNLRALCQRCHLRMDVDHHRATRARSLRAEMLTDDMLAVPVRETANV
jgi:hypothetical protein